MHRRSGSRARAATLVLVMLLVAGGCSAESPADDLRGARIEVAATWSGVEQQRFQRVLDVFERSNGVTVEYTPAPQGMPDLVRARVAAGDPPDVAFLPQPGLLRELAAAGAVVPVSAATRELVEKHFPPAFRELASYDGELLGVWFKAANKSLIWYHVATFERLGVVPPRDLRGLLVLARRLTAAGVPAFAVSGGSGWTLTDWFENLHLRLAGRVAYDALAAHEVPWTGEEVRRTLEVLLQLLAADSVAGGLQAAKGTAFAGSVTQVFGRPSRAAMVAEGDFVAGFVTGSTKAVLGVDADVFPFPAGDDGVPAVVGGGDVAVQLRPSAAGDALLRFLATPEAGSVWAAAGGFVSPNLDVDLSVYPDAISRGVARRLLEAGPDFRFDLSDLQPAAFGGAEDAGMRAVLRELLEHRDVDRAVTELEVAAAAAYEGQRS